MKYGEHPATLASDDAVFELTSGDLQAITGGLNPQPLPPCHDEFRMEF